MPTYEYICRECEVKLLETRSIHDPSPVHFCEKCGNRMNQVIGSLGIQFKGSGFYSKDK
jgi:putative FmdB family regulatory protein